MAINWFEGGRRISKLIMGIVLVIGAIAVWKQNPLPVLSTRGPTMPWFVSQEACPENAYVRYLWDHNWGGEEPGLKLCYLPLTDGSIPYAVAPTPPEAKKELEEESQNLSRIKRGEIPRLVMDLPWFYSADEYDSRVQSYVAQSVANFQITPEQAQRLEDSLSSIRWRDRKKALEEVATWVIGICAFLWAFTFGMGWIVRGFAGVPNGHDFKPKKET